MNKKARISTSFGRMAIASALALSTAAGVVVAPQMAAVAQAETVTATKGPFTVTKQDNGKYTITLTYNNPTNGTGHQIPMVDLAIHTSGITLDSAAMAASSVTYQDFRQWGNVDTTEDFSKANASALLNLANPNTHPEGGAGQRQVIAAGRSLTVKLVDAVISDPSTAALWVTGTFRDVPDAVTNNAATSTPESYRQFFVDRYNGGNNNIFAVYGYSPEDFGIGGKYNALKVEEVKNSYINSINYVTKSKADGGLGLGGTVSSPGNTAAGDTTFTDTLTQVNSTTTYGELTNLEPVQRNYYTDNKGADTKATVSAIAINDTMGGSTKGANEKIDNDDRSAADAYVNPAIESAKKVLADQTKDQTLIDTLIGKITAAQGKYNAKDSEAIDVAKAIAIAKLMNRDDLSPAQKGDLADKIASDDTKTGADIKKITDDADALKGLNASLDKLKGYLTDEQLDSYKSQLVDADADGRAAIVAGAENVGYAMGAPKPADTSDYNAVRKDSDKTAADAYLTDNKKQEIKAVLEGQSTDATKISDLMKKLVDAQAKYQAADGTALDIAKAIAITQVLGDKNIPFDSKSDIIDAINGGKTPEDVAGAADKVTKALEDAKKDAISEISKLPGLTGDQKKSYEDAINGAGSKDDVTTIKEGAQGVSDGAKDPNSDGGKKDASDVDKKAAEDAIQGLDNLTPKEKEDAIADIKKDETKTTGQVAQIVVDKVKTDAERAIDKLDNLTDAQKKSYKDQIGDAAKEGNLQKIEDIVQGAKNVNGDPKDSNAKPQDPAKDSDKTAGDKAIDALGLPTDKAKEFKDEYAGKDAKAIDVAKAVGKATVEALPNLSDKEKKDYQDQIDKATNGDDVKKVLDEAKGKSEENGKKPETGSLNDSQKAADKVIDALTGLTDAQKQSYKDKIAGETDPSKLLQIVKEAAVDAINNSSLTDSQKQDARDKINNGSSPEDIQNVVSQYTDLDAAIARAKKLLDEAATVRAGENYTKASDSLKKAYDDAISALQEKYDSAVKNGKDGDVSAADLTAYSDKVEAARDALTPAAGNSGSSLSSGPALIVWILGLLGLVGGVLGWGYVHDADFRAVVDGAIANVQRALGIIR
ncbi:MAG: hypothetical protein Q3962_07160 [Corynebacterium sp.]|nr:hypothetical protein [Corynebacterium sp.]